MLSLLDPRNCESIVKADSLMELAKLFDMDGPRLVNELKSYQSFISDLEPKTLAKAVQEMWCPAAASLRIAFPYTSSLLARVSILPAEVERVFS